MHTLTDIFIHLYLCVFFLFPRCKSQNGQLSLPEMCHTVPGHPVAPVRPASLLLRGHGERAGEVARRVSGLHPAHQQR